MRCKAQGQRSMHDDALKKDGNLWRIIRPDAKVFDITTACTCLFTRKTVDINLFRTWWAPYILLVINQASYPCRQSRRFLGENKNLLLELTVYQVPDCEAANDWRCIRSRYCKYPSDDRRLLVQWMAHYMQLLTQRNMICNGSTTCLVSRIECSWGCSCSCASWNPYWYLQTRAVTEHGGLPMRRLLASQCRQQVRVYRQPNFDCR